MHSDVCTSVSAAKQFSQLSLKQHSSTAPEKLFGFTDVWNWLHQMRHSFQFPLSFLVRNSPERHFSFIEKLFGSQQLNGRNDDPH